MTAYLCLALVCGTVWTVFTLLAWSVINGARSMLDIRARAVVEWQDCDKQERTGLWAEEPPAIWDAVGPRLDDQPDEVLLAHEADADLSEDNEAYAVNFMAWETQCDDLSDLAEQLGERAT